ncbi:PREDICTED: C-C chemokine receptor-like 2 [Miniopterus natalensis]|uniref:C-C chemokine receptor-like 2 n=1 Tax=Miniopterus natalensis TaxID=291302 RepID=UPI0007A6D0F4|nr:PREDICTED: C-C chemokine receptor-like 2 [Miniopterus natalensis]XP_016058232.1 PREDICTED: C-C chemokine receptor-like 2 [Miniopterus natalensis]
MANYTSAPDDDYYDVFIEDDLNDNETLLKDNAEQCHQYDPEVLSAQLVPQLYTVVSLVGLLDNFLVVFILVKHKRLWRVGNIYFLNLAISNLCSLLTLPFRAHAASHGSTLGHSMCITLMTLSSVGLHSEAFFNALLNYLVSFPGRRLFKVAGKVPCGVTASVLAWLMALLLALPEFLFYKSSQESRCFLSGSHFVPGEGTFWEHFLTLKMNFVGLLVPLLAFIVCLVQMRKTLRKHELFKLVFAISVVFLLMWGPYSIVFFLSTFKKTFSLHDCRSHYDLDRSVQVTRIIASTHCCVNPLLYMLLDRDFRKRLGCLHPLCGDPPLQPTEDAAQDTPGDECDHSTQL